MRRSPYIVELSIDEDLLICYRFIGVFYERSIRDIETGALVSRRRRKVGFPGSMYWFPHHLDGRPHDDVPAGCLTMKYVYARRRELQGAGNGGEN